MAVLTSALTTVGPVPSVHAEPVGTVTAFPTGTEHPQGLAAGPDGNLWFTNASFLSPTPDNSIGRMTPTGEVSLFSGVGIDDPYFIALGPDGNLWFTNRGNDSIGRITPAGVVSNYSDASMSEPTAIATGVDGNLWFTNDGNASIGRITPAGVVDSFPETDIDGPLGIVAGADGNVWFTNRGNNSIGRITPDGAFASYPSMGGLPARVAAGRDGNVWFTNWGTSSIGRITPTGVVTIFTDEGIVNPVDLVEGPDGKLWFANFGGSSIGWIVTQAVPGPPTDVVAVPGDMEVTVAWTEPLEDGGSPITGYTATASPGGSTCVWTAGPLTCVITGLANGTGYTVTVTATNATGEGPVSVPSISVIPGPPLSTGCGPTPAEELFSDVGGLHPFCADIEWLADSGVTSGYPDGTFRPGADITRQSMAAFLYRYSGSPEVAVPPSATFTDIPLSHPFSVEIEWLASVGITGGFPDGSYRPGSAVTRQSLAAFMYRLDGEPSFTPPGVATFADVAAGHPFFAEIEWFVDTHITTGYPDGTYRPGSAVTRQALAAFLHRFDAL